MLENRYATYRGPLSVPESDLFVVVPTVRPELLGDFCDAWIRPELNVRFIFVHDAPEVPELPPIPGDLVTHLCWGDIDAELGERRWIIPRRSDCVRSYGFLRARQMGARYILSLDDDCLPMMTGSLGDFFSSHLSPLVHGLRPSFSTTGSHARWYRPRGLPDDTQDGIIDHRIRVGINHGLWSGVIDRSGRDQREFDVVFGACDEQLEYGMDVVPPGFFYPMCGMNVCFDARLLPAMYFTLQGHWIHRETGEMTRLPYDRWGDIWCGAISKAVCDALGIFVTSGNPHVIHTRRSNTEANIEKESAGLDLHPHIVRTMLEIPAEIGIDPTMGPTMRLVRWYLNHLAANLEDPVQVSYLGLLTDAIFEWVELTIPEADR